VDRIHVENVLTTLQLAAYKLEPFIAWHIFTSGGVTQGILNLSLQGYNVLLDINLPHTARSFLWIVLRTLGRKVHDLVATAI
jgi:hypothetical protein